MQFYEARIVGDIKFDMRGGRVYCSLSFYFPVGSVFHFTGSKRNYVVVERERKPGLHYIVERADHCPPPHKRRHNLVHVRSYRPT